ncbi:MAG: flavin reductase family protein [Granulosicoccus sp.]
MAPADIANDLFKAEITLRETLLPMHVDMSALSAVEAYATMNQTIVPRPVAWILTQNDTEDYNLAPYSYFNAVSSIPPMVMFSSGMKPDGSKKDTRYNLEQRADCVIQIAHREMATSMTASSATLPRNTSEINELGLALADMPGTDLPRLADCRVAYAATLRDTKKIAHQWLGFLELTHLYLAESIVGSDDKGRLKVMAEKLDPLARLAGGEYVLGGDIISVKRPA